MTAPTIRFPARPHRARLHPPDLRSRRARRGGARAGGSPPMSAIDCTAPSLHVGILITDHDAALAAEDRPQADRADGRRHHHASAIRPARTRARKLLTVEQIEANKDGIKRVFAQFLTFGDGHDRRPHGRQCRVADRRSTTSTSCAMSAGISRSTACCPSTRVKLRLEREQELSFLEFNYMILQAYDFVELNRRYGCVLQMGGSDQWGNIVNGIDLGRRMGTPQLYALTSPLLTTSSGAKMGKTAAGAVWLNADMLSALRLLAVLAQHRGRAMSAASCKLFTDAAARRDRPARGARRRRDQRGQEGPGHRGDRAPAWPRGRRAGGRDGAQDLRGRRAGRDAADRRGRAAELEAGLGVLSAFVRARASSPRPARRAGRSRAAACASTTRRHRRARGLLTGRPAAEGAIKLSLGTKKHVLLKPR